MDNQLWFFTISVSFLTMILIKSWWRSKKSSRNLPPGPSKLPIIGNMHQLVGSLPHHGLTDLAKEHGPIMHLQLGQLSQVVISSPELAKEVTKKDLVFASRSSNLATSVILEAYNGRDFAFAPYGDHWRQMKKICTIELLSAKRVQSFKSIREEEVSNLIRSIASGANAPVNLTEKLINLSYCMTSRTAFGKARKQEEAFTPLVKGIVTGMGGFSIADFFPSLKVVEVISGMKSKLQKLHRQADAILEEIIRERREENKSQNNEFANDDLVSTLLNLQGSDSLEIPLTMQDIKAVVLDIFLAGIDSSSTLLGWAMSELVKHPEILEKAQAEVRGVLDGKEKWDQRDLNDLKYLSCVISETLRLHPPIPLIPRETRERVEICGYDIPEKTPVIINTWAILRDPAHWTDPETFSPERFLNNVVDYKGTNFEFIPFGTGRRICPGIQFGMSVVEVALANMLYHFDWKIPEGMKPEDVDMSEDFGVVVKRKNDLRLIPIPRQIN